MQMLLAAITVRSTIPAARQPVPSFGGLPVVRSYTATIVLFATSVRGLTILPAILGGYRQSGVRRPLPAGGGGPRNAVAALTWFSAGLWLPRPLFPGWLVTLTDLAPGGAATRAMHDATLGVPPSWQPCVILVAWTALGAAAAVRAFRWE